MIGRTEAIDVYSWHRGTYPITGEVPTAEELPTKVVATYVINGVTYVSESVVTVELPGFVVEEDKLQASIYNLDGLLEFAETVNEGNSFSGYTINLMADIDLAGIEWTPIKVDGYHGAGVVTINGNGATITNLGAPLFAGGFAGDSGIVIKNLTIADSEITSKNLLGSGAFIESIDSMPTITLKNCALKNSSLTGSRTGGLIGWTAGYNNEDDGPVKTYVTIKDCTVEGNTITGTETTGGIIGLAGNNAWTYHFIENVTVTKNIITSKNSSNKGVASIVGTANVGEVTITNYQANENTVNWTTDDGSTPNEKVYGRLAFGETGKLIIDGVDITE